MTLIQDFLKNHTVVGYKMPHVQVSSFMHIDAFWSYLAVTSGIWHSAPAEYLNSSIFISTLFVLLLKSLAKESY